MWWLLPVALAQPCPEDTSVNALVSLLEQTWEGSRNDGAKMREAVGVAEVTLGCTTEPLTPGAAARFHRNRALASRATGDLPGARAAARAAARLDPAASEAWLEASLVLRDLLAEAGTMQAPIEEFPTSLAAKVYADGQPEAARRTGEPVVLQVFAPDDTVVGAAWIDARQPMPDWLTYPPRTCETTTTDRLLQFVERAEGAYAGLDVDGFEEALRGLAEELPCLRELLSPPQAAAIHRLEGLRLATGGARLGVIRSFQQAQLLDGAYIPSSEFIREGSTLHALWDRAGQLGSPPWVDVVAPAGLTTRVDGIVSTQRPSTLPAILQVVGADGKVQLTRYVPPTAAAPDLGRFAGVANLDPIDRLPPALQVYKREERRKTQQRSRQALQLGGAVLYAGAGVFYALNANHRAQFTDPRLTPERATQVKGASNRSATAGTLLLVAGTAAIGVSFVIR